jgi:hypothetical protein
MTLTTEQAVTGGQPMTSDRATVVTSFDAPLQIVFGI